MKKINLAFEKKKDLLKGNNFKEKENEGDDAEYQEEENEKEKMNNNNNIQNPKIIQIPKVQIRKNNDISSSFTKNNIITKIPIKGKSRTFVLRSQEINPTKEKDNISIRKTMQEKKKYIQTNTIPLRRKNIEIIFQKPPEVLTESQKSPKKLNTCTIHQITTKQNPNIINNGSINEININYTSNNNVNIINNNIINFNQEKNDKIEINEDNTVQIPNIIIKKDIKISYINDKEITDEKIENDNLKNDDKNEEKKDVIEENGKKYASEEEMIKNGIEIYKCTEEEEKKVKEKYEKLKSNWEKKKKKKKVKKGKEKKDGDNDGYYNHKNRRNNLNEDLNKFELIRGKNNFEKGFKRERRTENYFYHYYEKESNDNKEYNNRYNYYINRGKKFLIRGKPNNIYRGWNKREDRYY